MIKPYIVCLLTLLGAITPSFAEDKPSQAQGGGFYRGCIKEMAGKVLADCGLEVTQPLQVDKYQNFVTVSTPSAPASGHSLLFANSGAKQFIAAYSDGSTQVLGASSGGTITGVTAGYGLTGGGTTGTVLLNVDGTVMLTSTGAAAAYLTLSSATATYDQINATSTIGGAKTFASSITLNSGLVSNGGGGTSGQVLQSRGAGFSPTWAAAGSSVFSVLCSSTVALSSSTTSISWAASNLGCTATMSNATHHVIVIATSLIRNNTAGTSTYAAMFRDSTNLDDPGNGQCRIDVNATGFTLDITPCTLLDYDAPGDTSAHAYRAKFQVDGGTGFFGSGSTSNMVVIETN